MPTYIYSRKAASRCAAGLSFNNIFNQQKHTQELKTKYGLDLNFSQL